MPKPKPEYFTFSIKERLALPPPPPVGEDLIKWFCDTGQIEKTDNPKPLSGEEMERLCSEICYQFFDRSDICGYIGLLLYLTTIHMQLEREVERENQIARQDKSQINLQDIETRIKRIEQCIPRSDSVKTASQFSSNLEQCILPFDSEAWVVLKQHLKAVKICFNLLILRPMIKGMNNQLSTHSDVIEWLLPTKKLFEEITSIMKEKPSLRPYLPYGTKEIFLHQYKVEVLGAALVMIAGQKAGSLQDEAILIVDQTVEAFIAIQTCADESDKEDANQYLSACLNAFKEFFVKSASSSPRVFETSKIAIHLVTSLRRYNILLGKDVKEAIEGLRTSLGDSSRGRLNFKLERRGLNKRSEVSSFPPSQSKAPLPPDLSRAELSKRATEIEAIGRQGPDTGKTEQGEKQPKKKSHAKGAAEKSCTEKQSKKSQTKGGNKKSCTKTKKPKCEQSITEKQESAQKTSVTTMPPASNSQNHDYIQAVPKAGVSVSEEKLVVTPAAVEEPPPAVALELQPAAAKDLVVAKKSGDFVLASGVTEPIPPLPLLPPLVSKNMQSGFFRASQTASQPEMQNSPSKPAQDNVAAPVVASAQPPKAANPEQNKNLTTAPEKRVMQVDLMEYLPPEFIKILFPLIQRYGKLYITGGFLLNLMAKFFPDIFKESTVNDIDLVVYVDSIEKRDLLFAQLSSYAFSPTPREDVIRYCPPRFVALKNKEFASRLLIDLKTVYSKPNNKPIWCFRGDTLKAEVTELAGSYICILPDLHDYIYAPIIYNPENGEITAISIPNLLKENPIQASRAPVSIHAHCANLAEHRIVLQEMVDAIRKTKYVNQLTFGEFSSQLKRIFGRHTAFPLFGDSKNMLIKEPLLEFLKPCFPEFHAVMSASVQPKSAERLYLQDFILNRLAIFDSAEYVDVALIFSLLLLPQYWSLHINIPYDQFVISEMQILVSNLTESKLPPWLSQLNKDNPLIQKITYSLEISVSVFYYQMVARNAMRDAMITLTFSRYFDYLVSSGQIANTGYTTAESYGFEQVETMPSIPPSCQSTYHHDLSSP